MTNVEVVESLKYGLKLFAYLLVIVVLGGGGMVLGTALAGPELVDGVFTSAELLGGLVLAFLGLAVWVTGMFGILYKLVADAVEWGVSNGTGSPGVPVAQERSDEAAEPELAHQIGPSPGEQAAREFGPEPTVPGAASVPDRVVGQTSSGRAVQAQAQPGGQDDQPEPADASHTTGEEVAHSDHATADDTAEEPVEASEERDGPVDESVDEASSMTDESEARPSPPEPTPEEIAFGGEDTADGEMETPRTGTDEPESDVHHEPTPAAHEEPAVEDGSVPPYDSVTASSKPESGEEPYDSERGEYNDTTGEDETVADMYSEHEDESDDTPDRRDEAGVGATGESLFTDTPDERQQPNEVDFFERTERPGESGPDGAVDESGVDGGDTESPADDETTDAPADSKTNDPLSDPRDDDEQERE